MNPFAPFLQHIKTLYALVMLQKSVRRILRAFWLGLAGVFLSWVLHTLFGWLPSPWTWLAIGLGFALVPLAGAMMSLFPLLADLPPPQDWIATLDGRLGLRHQLSTAWEVAQKQQRGLIADLLVQDLAAFLPSVRKQVLAGGWFRKFDLAAAALMTLLTCGMLAALLFQPSAQPAAQPVPPSNTAPQPPIQPPPGADSEQPAQEPGDQPGDSQAGPDQPGEDSGEGDQPQDGAAGNQPGGGGEDGSGQDGAADSPPTSPDQGAVADALRQLGRELSRQAGTFDLGQALESLEVDQAADALQDLNSQLDELSPETRANLAEALGNAAQNLEPSDPGLSDSMGEASDALTDPRNSPEDELDQVADDLRRLEGAMQAQRDGPGSGAGQGQSSAAGQAEPAERLQGEDGLFELTQENVDPSGLLSPARPDAPTDGTASGSLDANRAQPRPSGQNPLLPNAFLWKWRDVVSQYFQR